MPDLSDYPDLHRRETPEQEELLGGILLDAFDLVERLHAAFETWVLRAGTSLAGDDLATPYERLSDQVATCIGVGFDNLRSVRLLVADANTLPAFAHFGLIRNAIEAVGIGLWLIGPASRDKRILRSLQLAYEDRKDIYSLESVIEGREGSLPSDDSVSVRLEEIRDARPQIAGRSLQPMSITERLVAAQEYAGPFDYTILAAWKLTSGISHGRRTAMYALLDREVLSTNEVGARVLMTSSFATVAGTHKIAEHYLLKLLAIYSERNGTPLQI